LNPDQDQVFRVLENTNPHHGCNPLIVKGNVVYSVLLGQQAGAPDLYLNRGTTQNCGDIGINQ
jgi:hypothetical protein